MSETDTAGTSNTAPTLAQLAEIAGARLENGGSGYGVAGTAATGISLDSKDVREHEIFAALPGTRVHGATFAETAKAAAVLTDEAGWKILTEAGETRPVLVVEDVRRILGHVAAEIYGNPSRDLTVIGITGTSGKTTTTYMLESGLTAAGCAVGLIGTTGTRIKGRDVPTSLTTPEAPKLQELFADMRDQGVTHVVMEVSSHALVLGRVTGTQFAVGGFTNLSQDHLDFHPTMEDYFDAKAMLFSADSAVAASKKVICVDDEWGVKMAERAGEALTVGTHGQSGVDCAARLVHTTDSGAQDIVVSIDGREIPTRLPLPGAFNVANAALATTMAQAAGVEAEAFLSGIAQAAVPGRMERIDAGQEFVAVVDYAHKPAAVAAALDSLRGQVPGRIGVVLGAGGDRDTSKRFAMGEEAARRADFVIVTDDNPRSEDPAAIRAAIVEGADSARSGKQAERAETEIREIASRADAIDALIKWAEPGDAAIIVGKGHEVGQIIGETTYHFDDREEVRRALAQRGYGNNTLENGKQVR